LKKIVKSTNIGKNRF